MRNSAIAQGDPRTADRAAVGELRERVRMPNAVAGAAVLAAYAVFMLLAPLPAVIQGQISQVVVIGSAVACCLAWARSAWLSSGRVRLGMGVLAVSCLTWAVAESLWLATGWHTGGAGVPFPAGAVAAFTVTMVGTPTATALLVRRPTASLRTLLDGLLIGASLLYVMWALVIGPTHRAGGSGLDTLAYPLADVLIVSMVLLLLGGSQVRVRATLEMVAIGMVVMFAADTGYSYLAIVGGYQFGALPDLGWAAAFILISIGVPTPEALRGLATIGEDQQPRAYLPYVPFGLAFGTGITMFVLRREMEPALYLLSTVLTALVVIRQLITMKDNHGLTRQLASLVEGLRFRADHDPLTGLANRALFHESVERALGETTRDRVAVLYLDLDGFKPINDAYGHEAGDRVLTATAERLVAAAGSQAMVARLGGDEFAILLAEPDAAEATALAHRILAAVREPVELPAAVVRVAASIGIAESPVGRIGLGELLRDADAAMYAAKRQGRDRVVVSEPASIAKQLAG